MLEFHDRNLRSSIKELKLELILNKYSKDKENHHHHQGRNYSQGWGAVALQNFLKPLINIDYY